MTAQGIPPLVAVMKHMNEVSHNSSKIAQSVSALTSTFPERDKALVNKLVKVLEERFAPNNHVTVASLHSTLLTTIKELGFEEKLMNPQNL